MAKEKDEKITYKDSMEHVSTLIKAHVPIIFVVTHEEHRFIKEFTDRVAPDLKRDTMVWSQHQGLLRKYQPEIVPRASGEEEGTWDPKKALAAIEKHEAKEPVKGNVYILRDFHRVLGEVVPRQLRDMYEHLVRHKKTIIITAPYLGYGPGGNQRGLEPTLEKQIVVVDYALPQAPEIKKVITQMLLVMQTQHKKDAKKYADTTLEYTEEEINDLVRSVQGLTLTEIENACAVSISHLRRLDVNKLLLEKKQIIRKSDILEYIDTRTEMSQVGGMDEAKRFFDSYADSFTDEAKEYGVEPLKGVLFAGVPGTGKSLLAQAISSSWKLPLLRLDVGKVMTGLVGGSEQRMREALSTAEAVAPCILWIDEIEKALSGTKSSNFSDGGTLSRVFGTLLTSMQEGMKNITVIATANDISALPPELIRRFNEVFFVDLPSDSEREQILRIHLTKRKRNPEKFDIKEIVRVSDRYTGAELEKSVKESIAHAWTDGKRELTTKDLITAVKSTKPISQMMDRQINELREWARDRARYASSEAAKAAAPGKQQVHTTSGKKLGVDEALGDMREIETSTERNKRRTKATPTDEGRTPEVE